MGSLATWPGGAFRLRLQLRSSTGRTESPRLWRRCWSQGRENLELTGGAQDTPLPGKEESGNMPDALAEFPSSETATADSQTLTAPSEALAGLCQRVAALEALAERVAALERRLVKRRPDTNARRMTRPDKCPYGWKPGRDARFLVQDAAEQQIIFRLVELAQDPKTTYRELALRLDQAGCKRRGGKKWVGAHGLVRSILRREGVFTPADATAAVQRRIEETKRRAEDKYVPEIINDDEARARARGERR